MADDLQRLIVSLEARTRQFDNALAKANGTANRRARAIETRFAKMNGNLNRQFAGVGKGMIGAFAGVAGARAATGLIDAAIRTENALKVAGLAGEDLTRVYDQLFESAQRNAAPLEALVTLYSRVSLVQKDLGVTSEQIAGLVDNVGKALRLTGGDASQASGALLQLGQALGSNKIQAEEYNSLIDGLPGVLQAAANGIEEAGGSVSELTRLVKDGQISNRAFFDGIEAGAGVLDDRLASASTTVSQAFIRLRNTLEKTAGELNKGSGASEKMVGALDALSNAIANTDFGPLIDGAGNFGNALGGVIGQIQEMAGALGDLTGASSFGPWIKGKIAAAGEQSAIQDRIESGFAGTVAEKGDRVPATRPPTDIGTIRPKVSIKDPQYSVKETADDDKKKGSKRENEFVRETEQIRERTEALNAETAAMAGLNPLIDDYGFAVEKAAATQELLTAAKKAGLEITPALTAQIDALATGYANASVEAEKLAESQDNAREIAEEFRDIGKDVLGGFIRDLRDGKSGAEALANALDKVADKLLSIGLDALFGGGGGLGGVIASIFAAKDGGIAAHGKEQPLKKFARGGVSRHAAIFGEAGPEAAVPLPDGRRIPVDLNIAKVPQRQQSTSSVINMPISINAPGADAAALARVERSVQELGKNIPKMVDARTDARRTRGVRA